VLLLLIPADLRPSDDRQGRKRTPSNLFASLRVPARPCLWHHDAQPSVGVNQHAKLKLLAVEQPRLMGWTCMTSHPSSRTGRFAPLFQQSVTRWRATMVQGQVWYRAIKFAMAVACVASLMVVAGLKSTVIAQQTHRANPSGRPPVYSGPGLVYGGPQCPAPPAGFDPLAASADDLQYYGLQTRPHGDAGTIARWVDHIHHAQHRVCGMGDAKPTSISQPPQVIPTYADAGTTYIWAGYVATSGGFDWAWANWYVPFYTAPAPFWATAVQWVGLGGYPGNLWQCGTETDNRAGFQFWWEQVKSDGSCCGQHFQGPAVHPGDHVRVGLD
jgi:hypothetical protein